MDACGLIVEYNPFHNGHAYHINQAKQESGADCIIAVMSGSFLQRGEPAIMDKFHRAKAALSAGIDIVVELPYVYAVQSSDLFAKGSVMTLFELGVNSICFGSESGTITPFIHAYESYHSNSETYKARLKMALQEGKSFPDASKLAYDSIGLVQNDMDLSMPNNILGFSYVRTILENELPIQPITIKRKNSEYHDTEINGSIASATSIRKQLFEHHMNISELEFTMPPSTVQELVAYERKASTLHHWERYFPLLHYRVMTMTPEELSLIQGVDEGLEHRIKRTAKDATSFNNWVERIKTKRYTWTRIQRIFVHLLTNTKKDTIYTLTSSFSVPYIRLLGLTTTGKAYLNRRKKELNVPLYPKITRNPHPMLEVEERATNAYYSILPPANRYALIEQELKGPIIL
ncbi:nucleotidyltransferase [Ornithinibacillus scapharcae]|uniref:nucleotidyltransferase n=1 Tax=Ornithinibacillus scapharcae TaxID=1147159 RepID=UPI000225AB07|nr:nucleotidyltransferase [Ornithinibacillus scapharcae]